MEKEALAPAAVASKIEIFCCQPSLVWNVILPFIGVDEGLQ